MYVDTVVLRLFLAQAIKVLDMHEPWNNQWDAHWKKEPLKSSGATVDHRERDEIEKSFKALKNELDILPLNTHSDKTTRGFIFIAFLSLIIRSRLINMMREAKLLDKYSVELLLLQLEKFRKISLADGQIIDTEMTKKQREIIQALNLCA